MDLDLQKQLQEINSNLVELKNKKQGIWRSFFLGMFSALGYVAGLAIVVVILGWILNATGLLPAFKKQMSDFQTFFNKAKQVMDIGENASSTKASGQGNDAFLTLPDGKQVKIQMQQ